MPKGFCILSFDVNQGVALIAVRKITVGCSRAALLH